MTNSGVPVKTKEGLKMPKRFLRIAQTVAESIMIAWVILSFCLLVFWAHQEYQVFMHKSIVVDSGYPIRTNEELRRAQHYHGVSFAWKDADGEWRFKDTKNRDCKLFKD